MPYKNQLHLYADECFPLDSVIYLRSLGYSAIHADDRKAIGKSDNFHLRLAKKENKILISLDRDFLYYNQVNLTAHPGVIIIESGSAVPKHINSICKKALSKITKKFIEGSLIKITKNKIIRNKKGKLEEIII